MHKNLVGIPEGKRSLGSPREIILEWILEKQGGKVWIGCIWPRIGISGGLM
jgi:hypothetical protein